MEFFKCINWNDKNMLRGLIIMFVGIALLLYTLGIIETGINLLLIFVSLALIVYGYNISGLQGIIKKYFLETKKLAKQSAKPKIAKKRPMKKAPQKKAKPKK